MYENRSRSVEDYPAQFFFVFAASGRGIHIMNNVHFTEHCSFKSSLMHDPSRWPGNSRAAFHVTKLRRTPMAAFFLWCVLFVMCWPLALLSLVLYPIVWLLLLPLRIVGIAVQGVLALVWGVVMLPARLLSAPFRLV